MYSGRPASEKSLPVANLALPQCKKRILLVCPGPRLGDRLARHAEERIRCTCARMLSTGLLWLFAVCKPLYLQRKSESMFELKRPILDRIFKLIAETSPNGLMSKINI